jgi:hypothetical protein
MNAILLGSRLRLSPVPTYGGSSAESYRPPNVCVITLRVPDSAGQSDSDVIGMVFVGQSPD